MPGSPLSFSSAVPACGSFLLRSQEVQETKSRRVGDQTPAASIVCPQSGKRLRAFFKIAPQSSFPRRRESIVPAMGPHSPALAEDKFLGDDVDSQNRRNKARMYMKTKDRLGNRPPLAPSLPKEENSGLPSSDEEGSGVVGRSGLVRNRVCNSENGGTKPECI